jgi:tetratricopeptide (TPR) repeat protein
MNLRTGILAAALALGALVPMGAAAADASLLAQGDKQWAEGRTAEARKSFEAAVAADPKSAAALMKLGGLLLASNDHAAAVQTYKRAISLDSGNAKAWIGLGVAYLHTGQKDLSKAAFAEAVRADPSRKTQLAGLAEEPAQ